MELAEVERIDVYTWAVEVVTSTRDDIAIGERLYTRADLRQREVSVPAEGVGVKDVRSVKLDFDTAVRELTSVGLIVGYPVVVRDRYRHQEVGRVLIEVLHAQSEAASEGQVKPDIEAAALLPAEVEVSQLIEVDSGLSAIVTTEVVEPSPAILGVWEVPIGTIGGTELSIGQEVIVLEEGFTAKSPGTRYAVEDTRALVLPELRGDIITQAQTEVVAIVVAVVDTTEVREEEAPVAIALAIDDLPVAELTKLIRGVLIYLEAIAELIKALSLDTGECIDVVLGEVAVEVQDIGGRLDDKLIGEAGTLTTDTTAVLRIGAYVLEALEERVLDRVRRLEVEVIREGHLGIDTTDTAERTQLIRDVGGVEDLEGIVRTLHRCDILIVAAIRIIYRLVGSREKAQDRRLRERDTTTLTRVVTTTLLRGVGYLSLEGEIEPLSSLVVEVQKTRVALEATEGRDTRHIIVAQRSEVAEGIATTRSGEADIAQTTRTTEEDLAPVGSGRATLHQEIFVRDSSIGVLRLELLTERSALSVLRPRGQEGISSVQLVVDEGFALVVEGFVSVHQLEGIGSDTREAGISLEVEARLALLTALGRDEHDTISST